MAIHQSEEQELPEKVGNADLTLFSIEVGDSPQLEFQIWQYYQDSNPEFGKHQLLNFKFNSLPKGYTLWPNAVLLSDWVLKNETYFKNKKTLELGCGVGLVGLVCSQTSGAQVIVTDGETPVLPLVKKNISQNNVESNCKAKFLRWNTDLEKFEQEEGKFDTIVGSDVIYEVEHGELILKTVAALLKEEGNAFISMKERSPEIREKFRKAIPAFGLLLVSETDLDLLHKLPKEQHFLFQFTKKKNQ